MTPSPPPPRRDEARTQDRIAISDDAEEDQIRTQGQRERDNISYDTLPETANFPLSDGYVSFTRTFRYLRSLINYSLRDNDDITARIASATAAMGALKTTHIRLLLSFFGVTSHHHQCQCSLVETMTGPGKKVADQWERQIMQ